MRTPWDTLEVLSSGKAQKCNPFLDLPLNAVLCRAFCGGGDCDFRFQGRHERGQPDRREGTDLIGPPRSQKHTWDLWIRE